jgi:hypothetical protein
LLWIWSLRSAVCRATRGISGKRPPHRVLLHRTAAIAAAAVATGDVAGLVPRL